MTPAAPVYWAAAGSGAVTEALVTARLSLCPMIAGDAAGLHQIFADPQVMRYFDDPHRTVDQTERWVRRSAEAPPDETREFTIRRDGQIIGKAGIWKAPEIGFLLHRTHLRQGLMTEALEVLIPHLSTLMSLPVITADVDPRNTASLGLLDRLGFFETHRAARTIEIGGEWCDSVFLKLNAPAPT
jgi:[ribosomal protein S5]-alanine N-acetyltransferase